MRPDRLFLLDIVDAAEQIVLHIDGREKEAFVADKTARAAVLHELTVIGEAAARISSEMKAGHPEIPWSEIVAFRKGYFGLSWPIIWVTATKDVPELRAKVARILEAKFDDSAGG